MSVHHHPHDDADYELLENGNIRVRERTSGKEGEFAVGGRWISGTLRFADPHYIRYVFDLQSPTAAISPGLRQQK